jgi:flagellar biosynthesis protein
MSKAVAIKYKNELPAPFITAKGKGYIADKLIKIAKDNDIPVINDVFLSESLYLKEPGEFIPEEVYEIVAQLLVFIKETQELI